MVKETKRMLLIGLFVCCIAVPALAQVCIVKSHQEISNSQGGMDGALPPDTWFGNACAALGDLDGDGVNDVAVAAQCDSDWASNAGAVWILLLNADGTVKNHQKITTYQGGFGGYLSAHDQFGVSIAFIEDLNEDGVTDIAVGAWFDDDGGNARGAVWILFLNSNGTVKSYQKISSTQGNFTGQLDDEDRFGAGISFLGDFNNDGSPELVVGARGDDDGGSDFGAC